jgi:hypothetical protein
MRWSPRYFGTFVALCPTPQLLVPERKWVQSLFEALQPHMLTTGTYVNVLVGPDDGRIRESYGPKYDQLRMIKRKYDRQNAFRRNANITPVGGRSRRRTSAPPAGTRGALFLACTPERSNDGTQIPRQGTAIRQAIPSLQLRAGVGGNAGEPAISTLTAYAGPRVLCHVHYRTWQRLDTQRIARQPWRLRAGRG